MKTDMTHRIKARLDITIGLDPKTPGKYIVLDADYNIFVAEWDGECFEWAGKWNDPYRILYIDGRVEPEMVFVGRCISYGEIRFATEADAINCIKAVGEDRLKKYYFGIPIDDGCCTSER